MMNRKYTAGIVTGLMMSAVMTGMAHANLISNGSFEDGDYGGGLFKTLATGNSSITSWAVTGGSVDWINSYWNAADGDRSLDMSGNAQGTISTTFITIPGTIYNVSFDMAGNTDSGPKLKTLQAVIDAQSPFTFTFDTTGMSHGHMGWTLESFSFAAANPLTTLTFKDLSVNPGGGNAYGAALDNVIVNASQVPEPVTMLLFGAGLVVLAGTVLRKKK